MTRAPLKRKTPIAARYGSQAELLEQTDRMIQLMREAA